jgi:hypothetical protein
MAISLSLSLKRNFIWAVEKKRPIFFCALAWAACNFPLRIRRRVKNAGWLIE